MERLSELLDDAAVKLFPGRFEVFLVSQEEAHAQLNINIFLSKPENLVSSFGIRKYLVSFTKLWAAQLQSGC